MDEIRDSQLDRLIDGLLSEPERRELLLRLEAEPDGWRRLAVGFLEAQAWGEAFAPLMTDRRSPSLRLLPTPAPRPTHRPRVQPGRLAAMAASLIAASALGWAIRGPRPIADGGRVGYVATNSGSHDIIEITPRKTSPVEPGPIVAAEPGPPMIDPAVGLDREEKSILPAALRGRLERRGYRIEQDRGLLLGTRAGRPVAVPARRVQIRYVGQRST